MKVLLAGLLAFLVVVGCSGDDDDDEGGAPTFAAVVEATTAEASAQVDGTQQRSDRVGPVTGVYGADPVAAAITIPVFGVDPPGAADVRVVDDSLYASRTAAELDVITAAPSGDRVLLRLDDEAEWLQRPAAVFPLAVNPALLGPFGLLDLLADPSTELEPVDNRHEITGPKLAETGITRAEIELDDELRLARVVVETDADTVDYDVTDYGVDVDVEPPPAGDVTETGTPTGTAVTPAGDFTEIATGQQNEVSWQLAHAPASDGGTCWRFTSQPELVATTDACTAPREDDTLPLEFAVDFPFTSDGTGPADVVVVTSAVDIADAEFAFADGSVAEPISSTFNNGTGALVWIGPTEPPVGALTIDTAEGVTLQCGPGTITNPAEITNLDPAELAEQRTFPWACTS